MSDYDNNKNLLNVWDIVAKQQREIQVEGQRLWLLFKAEALSKDEIGLIWHWFWAHASDADKTGIIREKMLKHVTDEDVLNFRHKWMPSRLRAVIEKRVIDSFNRTKNKEESAEEYLSQPNTVNEVHFLKFDDINEEDDDENR